MTWVSYHEAYVYWTMHVVRRDGGKFSEWLKGILQMKGLYGIPAPLPEVYEKWLIEFNGKKFSKKTPYV